MSPKSIDKQTTLSFDQLLNGLGHAIFDSIRDPFGIFDMNYIALWVNKSMAWIHQTEPEKVIGQVCYEACYGRTEPCEDCPLEPVRRTGRTQVTEKWLDFPDGVRRWGEIHAYPIRGNDNNVLAIIVIVFDITNQKRSFQKQKDYSKYLSEKLKETTGEVQQVRLGEGDITINVKLSRRATEILRLMTEGYSNVQISELLSISPNTVKSHVNHIFNKLGVNDSTHAAVLATRHRLL